jgi:DNA ligase D-like protein (predicted 3'-phosphoesterase)
VAKDPLQKYRDKRSFGRTPEPAGKQTADHPGGRSFVVQRHRARRLHYDLRFEIDGVLVSWAVPKGPTLDPAARHLAVHVEDHPMEYADFEGTIPAQDYGGGSVIVWDTGRYRNLTERKGDEVSMRDGLDAGHVSVWLEGSKLVGGWSFTRTGKNWIMVKRRDDEADARRKPTSTERESVLSGQTVDEVGDTEDDEGDG